MRSIGQGRMWAALGIVAGVAFALEGILSASGAVFAVTAVVVGAVFALVAVLMRSGNR